VLLHYFLKSHDLATAIPKLANNVGLLKNPE